MYHYFKKALLTGTALLLIASTGANIISPANARRYRRYRYQMHRVYRRRVRRSRNHNTYGTWKHYWRWGRRHYYFVRFKTGYFHNGHWVRYRRRTTRRRTYRRARRKRQIVRFRKITSPQNDDDNESNSIINPQSQGHNAVSDSLKTFDRVMIPVISQQMKTRTLNNLNNDRAMYGLDPLTENPLMDQIAKWRAQQISEPHMFTHYDSNNNNQLYEYEDAQALGLSFYGWIGENLAGASLHIPKTIGTDSTPFNNQNGNDMADQDNDGMFNYDGNDNWGHRHNILDPHYHYVGIGVYVNQNDPEDYYLAEDFTYKPPFTQGTQSN